MSNFSGVQQGLVSGFQVGQAAGGKLSGLGSVLKKIASTLTSQRETSEAMGQKQNLLGMQGLISGNIESAAPGAEGGFDIPGMGRVQPVRETKSVIDPTTGKTLYDVPKKSVFKPKKSSSYTEDFRNDFRTLVDAVNQINKLSLDQDEKEKRVGTAKKRLKDRYPDKAMDIDDYF